MGKPTGFLEYERAETVHRPVRERILDYAEFDMLPADIKTQAARCMDCGVSFCHAGIVLEGASVGCPLGNIIPEINDLVYREKIEAAYARLSKTNPFPEITGRVCPALCESSCCLGEHEKPVAVKSIERFAADTMFAENKIKPRAPKISTGARVAVVGSGPAGLACADLLNRFGNSVTIFERADRAGGILTYGIPNMKLDKSIVERRISLMREEGIEFIYNVEISGDDKLGDDYDAVVLCAGAREERGLNVPGKDRVYSAMEFLTKSTKSLLDSNITKNISVKDKRVVIIGGGDTGTDCAATAARGGAKSVTQLEIAPQPPKTRAPGNPWPLWARVLKTDYGQEEVAELYGADPREFSTTVKEIIISGDGIASDGIAGVKTVKVEWLNGAPREIPGSEQIRPADIVLTAMGFIGPEKNLIKSFGLKTDARGNILTENYRAAKNIFAAGDARRGPSLVVWAISEGRAAARSVAEYLKHKFS